MNRITINTREIDLHDYNNTTTIEKKERKKEMNLSLSLFL